jgi:hypothetical protein
MKPKHDIMPIPDMQDMAHDTVLTSRLYSKDVDGGEKVQALVSQLAAELAAGPVKIDLRNPDLVQKVVVAYADACARNGALPSKSGLARAMGISRRALDYFIQKHPDEKSGEYLAIVCDSFAETLNAAALAGSVHPIVSIFLSKALYQFRDNPKEPEPLDDTADPLGQGTDAQEIADRYAGLLDELPD